MDRTRRRDFRIARRTASRKQVMGIFTSKVYEPHKHKGATSTSSPATGKPLQIDGLWSLKVGNGGMAATRIMSTSLPDPQRKTTVCLGASR
jgi:hypothetical protein